MKSGRNSTEMPFAWVNADGASVAQPLTQGIVLVAKCLMWLCPMVKAVRLAPVSERNLYMIRGKHTLGIHHYISAIKDFHFFLIFEPALHGTIIHAWCSRHPSKKWHWSLWNSVRCWEKCLENEPKHFTGPSPNHVQTLLDSLSVSSRTIKAVQGGAWLTVTISPFSSTLKGALRQHA